MLCGHKSDLKSGKNKEEGAKAAILADWQYIQPHQLYIFI